MTEFELARLENVLNIYATTVWNKPMPAVGLLYHEIVRLREEAVWAKARLMTQEIMAAEVSKSLEYELNKPFWQKVKALFR